MKFIAQMRVLEFQGLLIYWLKLTEAGEWTAILQVVVIISSCLQVICLFVKIVRVFAQMQRRNTIWWTFIFNCVVAALLVNILHAISISILIQFLVWCISNGCQLLDPLVVSKLLSIYEYLPIQLVIHVSLDVSSVGQRFVLSGGKVSPCHMIGEELKFICWRIFRVLSVYLV